MSGRSRSAHREERNEEAPPRDGHDEDAVRAGGQGEALEGTPAAAGKAPEGEDDGSAGSGLPQESADVAALKDKWLRAEADLQNYRRRAARDREEARRTAEEAVLLDVISVLDDLERALAAGREANAEAAWLKGVELVAERFRDTLARRGVVEVDPVGHPFDPQMQEALLETEAAEGQVPGTVVQVVLKGYRRGDRPLRPARVVVARGSGGDA